MVLLELARIFHKRWYWDHVQPQVVICLDRRNLKFKLDIRNVFVNPSCQELQFAKNMTIKQIQEWIARNIKTVPDRKDFWQFPFETLARGAGDCEDKNGLLANLIRVSGVPDWKVRLNAGMTNAGAHVWVTYFDGRKWGPLDFIACEYMETYFSWNAEKAFTKKENIEKWKK